MTYFALVRDALASLHPSAPWVALAAAIFAIQWAVRRLRPSLWTRAFGWLPEDLPEVARTSAQAAPSLIAGALVPAIASGGDFREALIGALVGAAAPVAHHVLKAAPGVPYRGQLAPQNARPPAPPLLLLALSLFGCTPPVEPCSADELAMLEMRCLHEVLDACEDYQGPVIAQCPAYQRVIAECDLRLAAWERCGGGAS